MNLWPKHLICFDSLEGSAIARVNFVKYIWHNYIYFLCLWIPRFIPMHWLLLKEGNDNQICPLISQGKLPTQPYVSLGFIGTL